VLGLVINEIDYDNVGDDTAEFIELLNTSATPVSLKGLSVMLVNGNTSTVYNAIDLSGAGEVATGQYLVLASAAVKVPDGALKVTLGKAKDNIENGAPDGVALVDTNKGVILDALSYEGSMTVVTLPGFEGGVSLVEGATANVEDSNTVMRSLVRLPNGYDTNNALADWAQSNSPTPGAPNL
jgi:hypothetical protein